MNAASSAPTSTPARLATLLVREKVMPAPVAGDAVHVAIATVSFVLNRMQPIQTASARLGDYIEARNRFTREEMTEYIQFALEMRRRVKEQLQRINPLEFPKVNPSYIDKESGPELLDKVRVDFHTDPSQAAFKAMSEA